MFGRRSCCWLILTLASPVGAAEPTKRPVDFAKDVFPVLQSACLECHGAKKQESGLRLDSEATFLKGGDSGLVVSVGKPGKSELVRRIRLGKHDADVMPPRGNTLTKRQIANIEEWIRQGAKWTSVNADRHWAYEAPVRPRQPKVSDAAWVRNPIDAFILARLDDEGLKPSPVADPAVLLRRLHFDLVGLPPTIPEAEAFVADPSQYEKIVDELLRRPQFGEKWARQWLDLARYADSHGFQRDDLREVWAYRDWVIKALNADQPFDQFTIEQVAGDLLPNATIDQKIATGFHRCSPINVEAGSEPEETRINQLFDRVNTTAAAWLGITFECCQCHDHKYDPFTQRDYYSMLAFFNGTEIEAERANPKTPGSIKFLGPTMSLGLEKESEENWMRKSVDRPVKPDEPSTLVMQELSECRPTSIFLRGDYKTLGTQVEMKTPAKLHPLKEAGERNRLTLGRWLVDRQNPLTARVVVNRWWGEIFGQGIVKTVEDFGTKGETPSHPELLDWLAVEFMERSWSMKQMLRTIVLSSTYRQTSRSTPDLHEKDPENVLLARGPRFRLDAEGIRDNALAISGLLSLKQFGPPIRPDQPDGLWNKVGGKKVDYTVSEGEDQHRRGIYCILKRGAPHPSFLAFDATARMTCTVKRSRSNTPLQALVMLNDPVLVRSAMNLAKRMMTEPMSTEVADRIVHGFKLAVARAPAPAEVQILRQLFEAERRRYEADPAAAQKLLAELAPLPDQNQADLAAWAAVAAALLNLDETITKG